MCVKCLLLVVVCIQLPRKKIQLVCLLYLCAVKHGTDGHYDSVGPSTMFVNLRNRSVETTTTGLQCSCVFVAVFLRVVALLFLPTYPRAFL